MLVIAAFCVVITIPRFVPFLWNWHIYEWETLPQVLDFQPRDTNAEPLEAAEEALRPEMAAKSFLRTRIEDPADNFASFYEALWRTERHEPGAVTRILHYGDSPTTGDLITADVRELIQDQFGDAGHGTYLIAKPWAWYGHRGIESDSSSWKIDPANMAEVKDGVFGLGGVSFRGGVGAVSNIKLTKAGHTRVTLDYWMQPGGGSLSLDADDQPLGTIDTNGEQRTAQKSFALPAKTRRLTLRVSAGSVRLFGFAFFKDPPGVLYDSLGLNGAYTRVLATMFDEARWAEELRQARPQLVIVNYGTNESVHANYIEYALDKELREIVRRIRAAVPGSSILIMSPMDRGEHQPGGIIGTVPLMPRLVEVQRRVARETGVAFFDTFQAMGGQGTMGRWYHAEPRLVSADFIHPLPSGARIVGTLFYKAIMEGYSRHKLRSLRTQVAHAGS